MPVRSVQRFGVNARVPQMSYQTAPNGVYQAQSQNGTSIPRIKQTQSNIIKTSTSGSSGLGPSSTSQVETSSFGIVTLTGNQNNFTVSFQSPGQVSKYNLGANAITTGQSEISSAKQLLSEANSTSNPTARQSLTTDAESLLENNTTINAFKGFSASGLISYGQSLEAQNSPKQIAVYNNNTFAATGEAQRNIYVNYEGQSQKAGVETYTPIYNNGNLSFTPKNFSPSTINENFNFNGTHYSIAQTPVYDVTTGNISLVQGSFNTPAGNLPVPFTQAQEQSTASFKGVNGTKYTVPVIVNVEVNPFSSTTIGEGITAFAGPGGRTNSLTVSSGQEQYYLNINDGNINISSNINKVNFNGKDYTIYGNNSIPIKFEQNGIVIAGSLSTTAFTIGSANFATPGSKSTLNIINNSIVESTPSQNSFLTVSAPGTENLSLKSPSQNSFLTVDATETGSLSSKIVLPQTQSLINNFTLANITAGTPYDVTTGSISLFHGSFNPPQSQTQSFINNFSLPITTRVTSTPENVDILGTGIYKFTITQHQGQLSSTFTENIYLPDYFAQYGQQQTLKNMYSGNNNVILNFASAAGDIGNALYNPHSSLEQKGLATGFILASGGAVLGFPLASSLLATGTVVGAAEAVGVVAGTGAASSAVSTPIYNAALGRHTTFQGELTNIAVGAFLNVATFGASIGLSSAFTPTLRGSDLLVTSIDQNKGIPVEVKTAEDPMITNGVTGKGTMIDTMTNPDGSAISRSKLTLYYNSPARDFLSKITNGKYGSLIPKEEIVQGVPSRTVSFQNGNGVSSSDGSITIFKNSGEYTFAQSQNARLVPGNNDPLQIIKPKSVGNVYSFYTSKGDLADVTSRLYTSENENIELSGSKILKLTLSGSKPTAEGEIYVQHFDVPAKASSDITDYSVGSGRGTFQYGNKQLPFTVKTISFGAKEITSPDIPTEDSKILALTEGSMNQIKGLLPSSAGPSGVSSDITLEGIPKVSADRSTSFSTYKPSSTSSINYHYSTSGTTSVGEQQIQMERQPTQFIDNIQKSPIKIELSSQINSQMGISITSDNTTYKPSSVIDPINLFQVKNVSYLGETTPSAQSFKSPTPTSSTTKSKYAESNPYRTLYFSSQVTSQKQRMVSILAEPQIQEQQNKTKTLYSSNPNSYAFDFNNIPMGFSGNTGVPSRIKNRKHTINPKRKTIKFKTDYAPDITSLSLNIHGKQKNKRYYKSVGLSRPIL